MLGSSLVGNALIFIGAAYVLLAILTAAWGAWCGLVERRHRKRQREAERIQRLRRAQIRLVDQPPSLWEIRRRPFDHEHD